MPQDLLDTRDHDLLVRLDTKLDVLSAAFSEVRASVAAKADTVRVDRLEALIHSMNNKIYAAMGALGAVQVLIHLLWK